MGICRDVHNLDISRSSGDMYEGTTTVDHETALGPWSWRWRWTSDAQTFFSTHSEMRKRNSTFSDQTTTVNMTIQPSHGSQTFLFKSSGLSSNETNECLNSALSTCVRSWLSAYLPSLMASLALLQFHRTPFTTAVPLKPGLCLQSTTPNHSP